LKQSHFSPARFFQNRFRKNKNNIISFKAQVNSKVCGHVKDNSKKKNHSTFHVHTISFALFPNSRMKIAMPLFIIYDLIISICKQFVIFLSEEYANSALKGILHFACKKES